MNKDLILVDNSLRSNSTTSYKNRSIYGYTNIHIGSIPINTEVKIIDGNGKLDNICKIHIMNIDLDSVEDWDIQDEWLNGEWDDEYDTFTDFYVSEYLNGWTTITRTEYITITTGIEPFKSNDDFSMDIIEKDFLPKNNPITQDWGNTLNLRLRNSL
jgi:hypothetical protein